MGKEVTTFGDIEIEKCKFHHHKNLMMVNLNGCTFQLKMMNY